MEKKKTLVLGASQNPARYSYLAVQKLNSLHHPVIALGIKRGVIGNTVVETERKTFEEIDTITLYINPIRQKGYYSYILELQPKRIIFNPGTENDELFEMALQKGILVINACTLVLLSTGQY